MVARKNEIMYNRYETLMDRQVKGKAVDTYSTLNEVLVNLFRDIMDIEQKAIVTQEFQDITNNDMHVIEAIGIGEPKNMSAIAKELSVTVGTLTIAMNSLVKKDMCFGSGVKKIGASYTFPCLSVEKMHMNTMPGSIKP